MLDFFYHLDARAEAMSLDANTIQELRQLTAGDFCGVSAAEYDTDLCRQVLAGIGRTGVIPSLLRISAVASNLQAQFQSVKATQMINKLFDTEEVAGVYIILGSMNTVNVLMFSKLRDDTIHRLSSGTLAIFLSTGSLLLFMLLAILIGWVPFNKYLHRQFQLPFELLRCLGSSLWSNNSYVKSFLKFSLR
eukprot:TRINITY_DN12847_c0_g1_i1.p1 TRINITY_DN12847_c0_g1~~TRINITY_DN12847_c0_g1_i1.p1  ORF type:complete len:191 (+),score=20.73 TRINITY_DN12847_c0_g1_i1:119-691(+)